MRATLSREGQLFGQLAELADGGVMIEQIGPMRVFKGDSVNYVLTVTDENDARKDLTAATAIELQVKAALDGPEPPLIIRELGNGVTIRNQAVEATKGQADIVIASASTTLTSGLYWLDVVVLFGTARHHVFGPIEFTIAAVVNPP